MDGVAHQKSANLKIFVKYYHTALTKCLFFRSHWAIAHQDSLDFWGNIAIAGCLEFLEIFVK
ncbi:hypothetical protein VB714_15295 [Spirulina sp. 06S082]|nr:hypothetical protein [Spirulina sp. 06S082]